MYSGKGCRAKGNFFAIEILLFATLFCFLNLSGDAYGADTVKKAGDVLMFALPAAAAGLTLEHKDGEGAIQLGESTALSIGVTYGLKFATDEKRPNGEDRSFPSTHASVSFSSAEFMRKRYGWEYGVPAYLAATFVAYSRVASDEHYTRDVIAGAAVGIGSSYLFTRSYNGWRVQPDVGRAYYGVVLSRSW